MRVEAYNQVQQLYRAKKVKQPQKAETSSRADQVEISSFGKDFQAAKAAVAASPDIREDLTASVKAQIQSGAYSVDNTAFAEKLIQKYEEMR